MNKRTKRHIERMLTIYGAIFILWIIFSVIEVSIFNLNNPNKISNINAIKVFIELMGY